MNEGDRMITAFGVMDKDAPTSSTEAYSVHFDLVSAMQARNILIGLFGEEYEVRKIKIFPNDQDVIYVQEA